MHTINIDFEVFKALTAKRRSEEFSENDVIREILGLPARHQVASDPSAAINKAGWVVKGVIFPEGTEFRATYKGQSYAARVQGGGLLLDGHRYPSPSAAAVSITGNPVNGWRFWEARLPGQVAWTLIERMRKSGN